MRKLLAAVMTTGLFLGINSYAQCPAAGKDAAKGDTCDIKKAPKECTEEKCLKMAAKAEADGHADLAQAFKDCAAAKKKGDEAAFAKSKETVDTLMKKYGKAKGHGKAEGKAAEGKAVEQPK